MKKKLESRRRQANVTRLRTRIGVRCAVWVTIFLLAAVPSLRAQQPARVRAPLGARLIEDQRTGPASAASAVGGTTQEQQKQASPGGLVATPPVHAFWDRGNDLWFAAVGAGRALDYASTLNLRRRGVNEALLTNSIVDNRPLFAGIEVAAVGASIGVSYIFHRTGHHRLERWTSIIHFGVATGGAIRNYALETPDHP